MGNVVLDLDGCLYVGREPVPGTAEALWEMRRRGFQIVLATNNSTRTPEAVAGRVGEITGFPVSPDLVVTSGMAAGSMLSPEDQPVLVVGEAGLRLTLEAAGLRLTEDAAEAATVVVGLDRRFDYERLTKAMQAVLLGSRLVATNEDPTFPTDGVPVPGAGAIVAAVEGGSGAAAEYAGKPHPPMRRVISHRLGPGPTWVVGDRPETDLALGKAEGWTTVLVLTGVTGSPSAVPADLEPDHIIDSVADLPGLLPQ